MTSFEDIPPELLSQIVWHLEDDVPSLLSATLVSSSFNTLVQPVLHNKLTFVLNDGHIARMPQQQVPIYQFLERLDMQPDLARLTRHIDLTWYCHNGFQDFPLEDNTEGGESLAVINNILELLPSLRSLKFSAPVFGMGFFKPVFLETNKMEFLTDISIKETYTTHDTIAALMCLPRIKSLAVSSIMRSSPMTPRIPDHFRHRQSSISNLYFGNSITLEDLSSLLLLTRALETLSFECRYAPDPWNWAMGATLSPGNFSTILAPTQHSLVALAIRSDAFNPLDIDGTRLDLHDFPHLRTLALASNFIFTTALDDRVRDGLWALLPPNLRNLNISFSKGQELVDIRSSNRVAASLGWLRELAHHKKRNLPGLARIHVQGVPPTWISHFLAEIAPIGEVFEENDLDLLIWGHWISRGASRNSIPSLSNLDSWVFDNRSGNMW